MKCHGFLCGAVAASQKRKAHCSNFVADLKSLLTSLEEEFGRLTLYVTRASTVQVVLCRTYVCDRVHCGNQAFGHAIDIFMWSCKVSMVYFGEICFLAD